MIPFGLVFIVMAIYAAVYNHHNATFKDRYSFFIVDEDEEADPLNERYGKNIKTDR